MLMMGETHMSIAAALEGFHGKDKHIWRSAYKPWLGPGGSFAILTKTF